MKLIFFAAAGDGKGGLPPPLFTPTCKWEKSCRVDVYSYKRNQFADTVDTSEEKLPISLLTTVDEIHDGERATIITGGNN